MTEATRGRRYTSPRRTQQAAQTRADILAVATELFAERGWAGTTIAAIAGAAGVAVDTVYSGFGSKAGLLAAAKDMAKVGDVDPTPLMDRPEYAKLDQGTRAERLRRSARLIASVNEATEALDAVWREAAAGDQSLANTLREREIGRRQTLAEGLQRVLGRPIEDQALDSLWILTSPEAFAKLRNQRDWTVDRYETWLLEVMDLLTD
jgi:AcrR family transcriptional regulator